MEEKFYSRGIGKEWKLACFVTGTSLESEDELKSNIAAFVESREAGQRVVDMFSGLARLDYRPSEPNWIQVKIGAAKGHEEALETLHRLVRENDNVISPELIAEARSVTKPAAWFLAV